MRKIFIKYNPYRVETTITIDGSAPKQNSRLNFTDRRLQEWIEELPQILFEEYSTRDFHITFHGTVLDYEDVEAMTRDANKNGFHMTLEHIAAKEVSDKESAIEEIFREIQAGPFDELRQPDIINAFNQAKSSDFEVNVVATMSAGKSTLINALLQQKLMPAKQEACTATITKIKDNDSDHFAAKVYDAKGNLIQTIPELTYSRMNSLNSNPDVSQIQAEGNIPFVTSDDVSLVLVDTPGPNNSRDPKHKAATYRMLDESSKTVVLYILNATQLAVNDDYHLLNHVADSMKVGGKQSRDRFIFVVNKLDDFRKGEDSVEAALTKVRDYLHDNGIDNPNIYPASALTALDIRTILAESDDDNDDEVYEAKGKVRKFNKNPEMYFESLAPLTPSVRGEIENRLAKARQNQNAKEEALIHCGIVPIEMAIKMYVQKYAKTAKIKNIVDTFAKRLESAKSFETVKQDIASNQDKQKEILAQLAVIKKELADGQKAKEFQDTINGIDYTSEIVDTVENVMVKAQAQITPRLSNDVKMNQKEAEEWCRQFSSFTKELRAQVQVDLEKLMTTLMQKSADNLLNKYKEKIAGLSQMLNTNSISIVPFEMMEGDIISTNDIPTLIKESETSEEKWEVVGSHKEYKEIFGFRRWLNNTLGTAFNVDYDVVKDYDWVTHTYIDGTTLSQKFLAPIQEGLYRAGELAKEYANNQTEIIKQEFTKRFEELDKLLKQKLKELENCANNSKNIEQRIQESENKLKWLEKIQEKTKSILDI